MGLSQKKADERGPAMDTLGVRADEYGELQRLVDALFSPRADRTVTKLDVASKADIFDLCVEMREVVDMLPSRTYGRARLCDQLNSIITAHGWGAVYGTVE